MNPTILFRKDLNSEDEYKVAKKHFYVGSNRNDCLNYSLVIGRYSVLPYYRELEKDLEVIGSHLINSYQQHRWIANFEYYSYLKEYTPETWNDTNLCTTDYNGPFVVKGKTNSRKYAWNKYMFASNKRIAMEIANELKQDGLIGSQDIIYRKYIPLKTLEIGLNELPFSNEWRLFCYKDKLISYGYYWSSAQEESIKMANLPQEVLQNFVPKLMNICQQHTNFYVLDIAETKNSEWILIEINDGQMSGLSENDTDILYSNLKKEIK